MSDRDVSLDEVTLHLRALPGTVPQAARLRRLLKFALRGCGYRCVRVTGPKPKPCDDDTMPRVQRRG